MGALAVMFTIEWRLALALSIVLPLCLWFTLSQRVRMKTANIEVKKKTADIYAAIESSISGIRTAKAFANEEQELDKFDEANALFKSSKVEYYKTMGLFQSGMDFTCCIAQVLVITVGGLLIMQGKMDYIDLVTFTLYVSTFISPIRRLTQFSEQYMNGNAGFTRFLELMRTEPSVKDRPGAGELSAVEGRVVPGGGWPLRRRQNHPLSAFAPVLRCVRGQCEGGRCGCAGCEAEQPPPEHRHDPAGCIHVCRYHPGEHPLRPTRRHR